MLYPDFFGWTRPTYSLLINIFNIFIHNPELTARLISLLFGIAAIPLAYLYIAKALNSERSGLLGALLLSLSFSHTIWGGFILSDTTGVFFLLLTLWLLFRNLYSQYELADWHDLLTGAVFAIAILTRYEYAVLIVPFIFLVYIKSPRPIIRLTNITAAVSLTIACVYFFLSPFSIPGSGTATQIGGFIGTLGHLDISGIQRFIVSDILIAFFSFIGIFLMFRDRIHRTSAFFVVLSLALLGFMYYQTNPAMIRYFTHLIPFLLLPASFGITKIIEWAYGSVSLKKYAVISICCVVLGWQSYFSYLGLHHDKNGIWFTAGYEAEAAKLVSSHVPEKSLIIVSFPEPYFLETRHATHSINDNAPFIYIPDTGASQTVIIVEDEGMRQIFPAFTEFLHKHMRQYKLKEIPLMIPFRYADSVKKVDEPIRLYRLELDQLKQIIQAHYEINYSSPML